MYSWIPSACLRFGTTLINGIRQRRQPTKRLLAGGRRLVTTHLVLCECGNAAARRPYQADVKELRDSLTRENLLIEPTPDEIEAAWKSKPERRRLDGLYLDVPEEWDDPYRFFRW